MGRCLTARAQHQKTSDETGWLPLRALHHNCQGLPEDSDYNKKEYPRHRDPIREQICSTFTRPWPWSINELYSKRLQKEQATGPQMLIVGDKHADKIKVFWSKKNTDTLFYQQHSVRYHKENCEDHCWVSNNSQIPYTYTSHQTPAAPAKDKRWDNPNEK